CREPRYWSQFTPGSSRVSTMQICNGPRRSWMNCGASGLIKVPSSEDLKELEALNLHNRTVISARGLPWSNGANRKFPNGASRKFPTGASRSLPNDASRTVPAHHLPNSYSSDVIRWKDGDTTKSDPFFILVLNNIAFEQPLDSNNFVGLDGRSGSVSEQRLRAQARADYQF